MLIKVRFKNRYVRLAVLALFLLTVLSWLFGSGIIQIFWGYGEDVSMPYWDYVRFMLDQLLCWEFCIDSAMRYSSLVFPLFACIPVLNFVEELNSYYILGAMRWKKRRKPLLQGVAFYVVLGGAAVVVPLLTFITVVDYFMYPALDSIGGLVSVFPKGFYVAHPYLTYFLMISVLYFLLAMSYSLMACGIALLTENKILVLAVPLVWYFLENMISRLGNSILVLSTLDVATSFNTLKTTGQLFVPILVQFVVSFATVAWGIYRYEHKTVRG